VATPTIRDVAREAGVGVGTVSRVLSNQPRVSPATRARVEAAIAQLGYRPNPVARALSRHRTYTLEVAVPLITRDFYVEVLRGIEMALAGSGYALVIRTIDRAADRDRILAALASRDHADGAIVVSQSPTPALLAHLTEKQAPAVLVDARHPQLPSIAVDHETAAETAVRHLLALGHQHIALVDHAETPFAQGSPSGRRRGFLAALSAAGIVPRATDELVTEFSAAGGEAALQTLFAQPDPPTAIFAGSDVQAAGILAGAQQLGLRVPEDLAVVGYNDIELAGYLGLTTMRVPMREMGRRGVELLLAAIDASASAAPQILLQAELIARHSTDHQRASS
jgi:DNA-binding LacI/PurR family transcriptional regulator